MDNFKNITKCDDLESKSKCYTREKDTFRCCPESCKEESALTENQCNGLTNGDCIYPNEAQCTGNFDQTNNNTIELRLRGNCMKY